MRVLLTILVFVAGCDEGARNAPPIAILPDYLEVPRICSLEFVDSLGAVYPTKTDERGNCWPGAPGPLSAMPECNDDLEPTLMSLWGPLFSMCPGCNRSINGNCRPLVCDSDDDCPIRDRHGENCRRTPATYVCRNGLCQTTDHETYPPDGISVSMANDLCQAPVERGESYDGPEPCAARFVIDERTYCDPPLPDACLEP